VLGLRHLLRRDPLPAGGGAPNCVQGLHISKILVDAVYSGEDS
jgi:hypothetical protein